MAITCVHVYSSLNYFVVRGVTLEI